MTTQAKTLEELIRQLPPHRQDEVRDFVEFLIARQSAVSRAESQSRPGGFERLFGAWDSGDENSADSERIEADLAQEYANPHEAGD